MRIFKQSILALLVSTALNYGAMAATVSGQQDKWHPVTVDFQGPLASETDDPVNPFLDYRLTVDFISPSGQITRVPGFFAGDGQGGGQGSVWRARFSADEVGRWTYRARLHSGENIAVNLDLNTGDSVALPDATGQFDIGPLNTSAPGFLRYGRLEYVGDHYLKFRDGSYWIKGGTDSPENLLGYAGFDGTVDQGGIRDDFLHLFEEHRRDFRDGDPEFNNPMTGVDSRGLIGALNYLGDQGVNSVYFLPMNLGGDGQETFPFTGAGNNRFDKTHYDISKLYQWNLVLNHAQEQGIALNIVLSETETANERWLDNGELGIERRLFFRELIARFGYLLAVKWNLGEENDFRLEQLQQHADYIQALDWSAKPIAVHTHINQFYRYGEIVGDPRFTASSIQYDQQFAGQFVEQWRARSRDAGRPWILDMDENTNGLGPNDADTRRKQILYDVLFSGGNIEWYFGYQPLPVGGDIDAGNFRYREPMWRQMRLARELMLREMPFWEMRPADELVRGESNAFGGAEVFVKDNQYYAIYLPQSNGQESLNLNDAEGLYRQRWFNPRTGAVTDGISNIAAGADIQLGAPPSESGEDWVVLIDRVGSEQPGNPQPEPPVSVSNAAPAFENVQVLSTRAGELFSTTLTATDADGTFPVVTVGSVPAGMQVNGPGNGELRLNWQVPESLTGQVAVELIAIDALDRSLLTRQTLSINVLAADAAQPQSTDPDSEPGNGNPTDGPGSAPRFVNLPTVEVWPGDWLELTLLARSDGDASPVVTVGAVPPGMRVDGPGDGRLILTWNVPQDAQARSIVELIAFDASDSALSTTQPLVITVKDRPSADTSDQPSNPGTGTGSTVSAPVLRAVSDQTVRAGEQLTLTIAADDADGIPPAIVLQNPPAEARFEDNGNGGRTFIWRPADTELGTRVLRFSAYDAAQPNLTDELQVRIEVLAR